MGREEFTGGRQKPRFATPPLLCFRPSLGARGAARSALLAACPVGRGWKGKNCGAFRGGDGVAGAGSGRRDIDRDFVGDRHDCRQSPMAIADNATGPPIVNAKFEHITLPAIRPIFRPMYRFHAMGQGGSMARGTLPVQQQIRRPTIQFNHGAGSWRCGCPGASKKSPWI